MTAAHLVLVWEERDDPNLLWHAQRAKEVGRNPRIVEYETSFGPSASYYAWEAAGRPVHGVKGKKARPSGSLERDDDRDGDDPRERDPLRACVGRLAGALQGHDGPRVGEREPRR